MKILETSNYDMFELIESNRPIRWNKIEKMRERIRHKNLTSGYNIIVNSKEAGKKRYGTDGKKYPIVDGQHRYISCKLEGQKFFYQVNDDIELDDIPTAASLQHSWILIDYLHHYSTVGIHAYKQFVGYMNKNEFPPSTTLIILCGERGRHVTNNLKSGNLKITRDWNFSNAFAMAVDDLGDYINFNKHARFLEAFLIVFSNKEYSHKRMIAKMEYLSSKMQRCTDARAHLEQLEYIYNYHSKDKIKLNTMRDYND
jgi:hypothetical protein